MDCDVSYRSPPPHFCVIPFLRCKMRGGGERYDTSQSIGAGPAPIPDAEIRRIENIWKSLDFWRFPYFFTFQIRGYTKADMDNIESFACKLVKITPFFGFFWWFIKRKWRPTLVSHWNILHRFLYWNKNNNKTHDDKYLTLLNKNNNLKYTTVFSKQAFECSANTSPQSTVHSHSDQPPMVCRWDTSPPLVGKDDRKTRFPWTPAASYPT